MPYVTESTTGEFGKFVDMITKVKDAFVKPRGKGTYLDRSSIARATKDLIASFPVLCEDSISPETAGMIAKAQERKCVNMLQLLLQSAYLTGESGKEVLAKYHTNMDQNFGMDEFLDIAKNFDESSKVDKMKFEQIIKEFAPMLEQYRKDIKMFYPESSFSECGLNGFEITPLRESAITKDNFAVSRTVVKEDMFFDANGVAHFINDELNGPFKDHDEYMKSVKFRMAVDDFNDKKQDKAFERLSKAKAEQNAAERLKLDKDNVAIQRDKFEDQKAKNAFDQKMATNKYAADQLRNRNEYFQRQLLDNDVKKINELVPSMLVVNFKSEADNSETKSALLGVKTRLITAEPFDIIDRICSIEKNKVSLINLVRATTKEISFSRDFVMAIDQAKIDVKKNSRLSKSSPIWRTLQNRSTKSVLNRLRRNKPNDAGAITTLVVSGETINILKKEHNIDLTNVKKAQSIMEAFNLLCLVIVDEQIEVARFLYDGERYYQDYSFTLLERETGDSSYKKIINLISKVNRG